MHGSRGPDRFPLTIAGCLMRSSRETSAARAPEVQLNEEQAARQKVFEVGEKIIKRKERSQTAYRGTEAGVNDIAQLEEYDAESIEH
ncbi:hypothetical protein DSECCO2_367750 [anaerobic digester metagenome]